MLFLRRDYEKFAEEFLDLGQKSGSTATMCIVHKPSKDADADGKHRLRVINAGDSRVLLGHRDGTLFDGARLGAVRLSAYPLQGSTAA